MTTNANAALRNALIEAQAGLEFAAALLPQTTDFVPSHIAALKIVNAALTTAAAVPPEGFVMVPVELAERVQESLGEFLMDHGWRQRDMDTSDDFGAVLLSAAPKAEPALVGEQDEPREDASYESMNLAVMVLSDCGHSSNYIPLLERVAGRIDRHVERLLTAQQADRAMRAQAAPQPAVQQGWDIDAAVEKAWGRFQAAMDKDEPLPPPSIHATAHYGTWLGREAHRHDEPKAGAFRNAARMLAVLEAEIRRLHAELIAAHPAAPVAQGDALTQAARDVLAERQRQIIDEGWTPEHDDKEHLPGELALAAASYLCADERDAPPAIWPWDWSWWKPRDRRRNLIKSGALILAEIERIDRAQAKEGGAHA